MASDPRELICELGSAFYNLGWVSGTGGGISIREGESVYIAPSGVQKERILPENIFTLDRARKIIAHPDNLALSACALIFFEIYDRTNAGAVIHNHGIHAARASLAFDQRFKITGIEMQKGISGYDVFDLLHVPIIENVSHEKDLAANVGQMIESNPSTSAILVRGHGVYIWGKTWEHAKTQAECYDYLFRISLEEAARGIDLSKPLNRHIPAYYLDTAEPVSTKQLAQQNIRFDNINPCIEPGILRERLHAQGCTYNTHDTIKLNLNVTFAELKRSRLEEKLHEFEREHKHRDDEVRHITSGEGIFDIRDNDNRWIRLEVGIGDFLAIPAERYHRFFLTQQKKISAIRYFKDREGWVPEYRSRK